MRQGAMTERVPRVADAQAGPAGDLARADSRHNREQLLAAARSTFAAEGADASLRAVARTAGVGIATLYRHFPTREALLEALLGHGFDTLRGRAAALLSDPDPGAALIGWARELAEATGRYDGLPASVLGALHDPGSRLHASCQGLRAAAGDLLARAQRAGAIRPDLDADELLAVVGAVAWAARQLPPAADPAGRFLALLVEGLAARPVPPASGRAAPATGTPSPGQS
jgi:AcrR family transcriptional regulator